MLNWRFIVNAANLFMTSWMIDPNPDIEKIDIGSHMDLEKFFLN
jgi:hypothetical protein